MSRARADPRLAASVLLAAALALAYVLVRPPSADLAAQVYRTGLFSREGFTLWDGQWYGGHHTPGYSTLYLPLASLIGVRVAAGLAAIAAAGLFAALARRRLAPGATLGSAWFALGTVTVLLSGRLTFAFALPFGLAAMLALERRRPVAACILAALCTLASPVAGVFAALGGAAAAVGGARRGAGLAVAVAALAPALALAEAFPEGGSEPFGASSFWPVIVFALVALVLLPGSQRVLRAGVALYALGSIAALLIPTPVGGNVVRLGALVAGPLAACVLWPRRRRTLAIVAIPLLVWQWTAAARDLRTAVPDPSVNASYYTPLLHELASRPGPPGRLEIPWTRDHWEAAYVAPHVALARGWERQLDRRDNALFYRSTLTAAAYRRWLDTLAVRWVALPDARLDYSARREAALIAGGLPWLRPVWRGRHWRLYAVVRPAPLAAAPLHALALGSDSFVVRAHTAGEGLVRVRFTPYWALVSGHGCVRRAGAFTAVRLSGAETVRVATRFSLGRIGASGPRCR